MNTNQNATKQDIEDLKTLILEGFDKARKEQSDLFNHLNTKFDKRYNALENEIINIQIDIKEIKEGLLETSK